MSILEVKNLNYKINDISICENINISFKEKKFTGIIGPNGSGKSTLLKQIYRSIAPTKGSIYLKGSDIKNRSSKEIALEMSVLPQENQNDFDYSVEEVVLMGRFPYHKTFDIKNSYKNDINIMKKYLKIMGLENYEKRTFRTLSGGEKQRVLLSRALVQEGKILVLDEVTNHLDIGYQYKILEIIKSLELTVIAAIHDLNLALKFCDEVILIDKGKIINIGNPEDIISEEILKDIFNVKGRIVDNGYSIGIDYISSYY